MNNEEKKDLSWAFQVLDSDREKASLAWAVNYVRYGKVMLATDAADADIKTQILYILNNISHWRHPDAKRVREILKAFVKAH